MEKRASKIIIGKSFTLCVILTGLTFLFTSCENFMKATAIKQELEQALNYANSDFYTIKIDYPVGTGVLKYPAGGIVEKKVTDVFNITFEPFTDYAFVCWKITDSITGKEIKNGEYLNIENTGLSDTKCTFTNSPAPGIKLCLNAVVAERPQIISYSPSSTDIMRDCSILVLFDRDMNPYSIYYTDQEIADLQKDTSITLLRTTLSDGSSVVYGYNKGGDVVFKNISITNKKSKENLTGYYDPPTIEDGILTIPANRANPPKGYTQIMVTLSKGFYYSLEGLNQTNANGIELAGSKKWMYQVNNSKDEQAMKPRKGKDAQNNTIDLFIVKLGTTELKSARINDAFVSEENDTTHIKKNIFNWYIKPNNQFFLDKNMDVSKIYLNMSLEDGMGSGPKPNFNVKLQKVANADYTLNQENNSTIFETTEDYLNVSAQEAFFEGEFALGNLLKEDGVYLLTVTCEDKSNNPLIYQYIFARDTNPPPANDIEHIILDKYEENFTFRWRKSVWDVEKTVIHYEGNKGTHTEDDTTSYPSVKIERINNIDYNTNGTDFRMDYYDGSDYLDIYVEYFDFAGHITTSNTIRLQKNAINQSPVHSGSYDPNYTFGNYPQSKCTLSSQEQSKMKTIEIYDYATPEDLNKSEPDYAIWHSDWYLGPDGYFYEKFNNNYYKIEPIEWKVYDPKTLDASNYQNAKKMIAKKILSTGKYKDQPIDVNKAFTQAAKDDLNKDYSFNISRNNIGSGYALSPVNGDTIRTLTDYAAVQNSTIYTSATPDAGSKTYWWLENKYLITIDLNTASANPVSGDYNAGYVPVIELKAYH